MSDNVLNFQKSDNGYVACCPFHEEKTPSFCWARPSDEYYCFSCGVKGHINNLNQDLSAVGKTLSYATIGMSP